MLFQKNAVVVEDFYVNLVDAVPDLIEQIHRTTARLLLHINGKLEKLQEEDLVERPFKRKQIRIRFPEWGRSGRFAPFGDKVLFSRANLTIERGEKLAIISPNGCGKSTLLKLIMGLQEPIVGEVLLGEHNVLTNFFEQNQWERRGSSQPKRILIKCEMSGGSLLSTHMCMSHEVARMLLLHFC
ncbi:hemin import ATP-binding protein HmuV-like [Rosa sericea]